MTLNDVDLALANTAHELADLQRQRDALLAEAARPWPKRVTLYVYAEQTALFEEGTRLGLTGDALFMFGHAQEYTIEVTVAEDGRVSVVSAHI